MTQQQTATSVAQWMKEDPTAIWSVMVRKSPTSGQAQWYLPMAIPAPWIPVVHHILPGWMPNNVLPPKWRVKVIGAVQHGFPSVGAYQDALTATTTPGFAPPPPPPRMGPGGPRNFGGGTSRGGAPRVGIDDRGVDIYRETRYDTGYGGDLRVPGNDDASALSGLIYWDHEPVEIANILKWSKAVQALGMSDTDNDQNWDTTYTVGQMSAIPRIRFDRSSGTTLPSGETIDELVFTLTTGTSGVANIMIVGDVNGVENYDDTAVTVVTSVGGFRYKEVRLDDEDPMVVVPLGMPVSSSANGFSIVCVERETAGIMVDANLSKGRVVSRALSLMSQLR